MGWSDPGPEPRDAQTIASELHTLLDNARIEGPFVLVGHSFGGLYARMYTAQYPDQVVGMVLVDSTHPDQWTRLPPEVVAGAIPDERLLSIAPFLARLGLTRLLGFFPADPELPAQHRSEIKAFNSSTKYMAANSAELLAITAASAQVLNAGSLGDRPLVVLTALDSFDGLPAGLATRAQQAWEELQADLAGLSSNSIHRLIEGDNAYIVGLCAGTLPVDSCGHFSGSEGRANTSAICPVTKTIAHGESYVAEGRLTLCINSVVAGFGGQTRGRPPRPRTGGSNKISDLQG